MTPEDELKAVMAEYKDWGGSWGTVLKSGDTIMITPLAFHVSLYVNPHIGGGGDERYCFSNQEIAIKAANEYGKTGVMKWWQKHHNANISILGSYAYRSGSNMILENALFEVDWDATEIQEKYPYHGWK